jgi:hypothetical protein
MGRGAGANSRGSQARRPAPRDIHEAALRVIQDVIQVFVDDCVSTFPHGAALRVFDRKGGRRILHGEADVTQLAWRILFFTLPASEREAAWRGDPRDLIRLVALGLYGEEDALHCADLKRA